MDKESILNLILSETDESIIEQKLNEWFVLKPELIKEIYPQTQNIFHLLIYSNRLQVLSKLLEKKEYHEVALKVTKRNHTLLHYAIKTLSDPCPALTIILDFCPDLLNVQSKSGATALHHAVIYNRLHAVVFLLKQPGINQDLKNTKHQTAFDLVKSDIVRHVFRPLDFSKFILSRRKDGLDSRGKKFRDVFVKQFPRLSQPRVKTNTPFRGLKPTVSRNSEAFIRAIQSDGKSPNNRYSKSITINPLFTALNKFIDAYQEIAPDFKLLVQINDQCNKFILNEALINNLPKTKKAYEAIRSLITDMALSVDSQYDQSLTAIHYTLQELLELIVPHLGIDEAVQVVPVPPPVFIKNKKMLHDLWLLTACQNRSESKRIFAFEKINNRALGLLNSYSLDEILNGLGFLYQSFDRQQKIIANYVVGQFMFYEFIDRVEISEDIEIAWRLFISLNENEKYGLEALLATKINEVHDRLKQEYLILWHKPLLANFYWLNRYMKQEPIKNSFDEIVKSALTKEPSQRMGEIQLIAQELRVLTLSFYQNVSLKEFNNGAKQRGKLGKENIDLIIDYFNKLNSYFMEQILAQPKSRLIQSIQFLIELACELCPLSDELYPDLNQLMMVCSILNNNNIIKLTESLGKLSSKDINALKEINKIISTNQNWSNMRSVYRYYHSALPFVGTFTNDINYANEGNFKPKSLNRASFKGVILTSLMELKLGFNFKLNLLQTDVSSFLQEYIPPNELAQEYASRRYFQRVEDRISLDIPFQDMDMMLNKISKKYLDYRIIPGVVYKNYPNNPSELADILLLYFNALSDPVELCQFHKRSFATFKEVISRIVKINNRDYFPRELSRFLDEKAYEETLQVIQIKLEGLQKSYPIQPVNNRKNNRLSLFVDQPLNTMDGEHFSEDSPVLSERLVI
ncbi:MAG: RasGEF domain-containing protein [Legionella sp.]|nr:RasGEF domain-containing protein [Legionella sp.]